MNNFEENSNDEEDVERAQKVMEAFIKFNEHFVNYIKSVDMDLFRRACDYAKTYTVEDVDGISLDYINDKDKNENEQN